MKGWGLLFCSVIVVAASSAAAQTPPPPVANPTNAGGTATVQSHLRSLGYKDVHDLHQGPDGQWVGTARQNGVGHTVTIQPNGTTIAR
jgi:hypothetical protein